jgi:aromatic ring hydroxylase
MANRLYNKQTTPKGYKRGGGVKKPGKVKSFFGKIRKKIAPTFGEQAEKARKEGKKVFRSTRDDKTKGKLYYSSKTADQVKAEKKRMSDRERSRVGDKSKQLTDFGAAYKLARKSGKKTFTHKGKKYSSRMKGEQPNKKMFELSGKTSKKIKKFVGA